MRVIPAAVMAAALVAAVFVAVIQSESTSCYAAFETRAAADRAADRARSAGLDVEVEEPGPDARRPSSRGARLISVAFSSGESGDDAAEFREEVRQIAEEEGAAGEPAVGCSERSRSD
jgi:hypothetical protein